MKLYIRISSLLVSIMIYILNLNVADSYIRPKLKVQTVSSTRILTTINKLQTKWIGWKNLDQAKYISLLTFSSIVSTLFSHPFQVLMLRQQSGKFLDYEVITNIFDSIRLCVKTIGINGLLKGWIPIFLEAPSYAIYFAVTESSKEFFIEKFEYLKFPIIVLDAIQTLLSR